MKFLLNMNLPRALGEALEGVGHEIRHAGDIGLSRAEDDKGPLVLPHLPSPAEGTGPGQRPMECASADGPEDRCSSGR